MAFCVSYPQVTRQIVPPYPGKPRTCGWVMIYKGLLRTSQDRVDGGRGLATIIARVCGLSSTDVEFYTGLRTDFYKCMLTYIKLGAIFGV